MAVSSLVTICNEGTPVGIKQDAGRAAEQVWTFWRTEKILLHLMGFEIEKKKSRRKKGRE